MFGADPVDALFATYLRAISGAKCGQNLTKGGVTSV